MISMPETKPSIEPIPLSGGDADFKEVYKDWQAIRIIRDNYFDGWRMFYTFFVWFGTAMLTAAGFIIANHPFKKMEDAHFAGYIGSVMIFNVFVFAVLLYLYSMRHVKNLRLILMRTGDADFLADKVLSARGAAIMASGAIVGLVAGLLAWVYVFFFYYFSTTARRNYPR
jgi:hypothetical protein